MSSSTRVQTQDIVLAATLKTLGYTLSGLEKVGNKGIFIFENVSDETLLNFDLGKLLVEPVAFNASIKALTTASRRTN